MDMAGNRTKGRDDGTKGRKSATSGIVRENVTVASRRRNDALLGSHVDDDDTACTLQPM
jgi:hypothetical protein